MLDKNGKKTVTESQSSTPKKGAMDNEDGTDVSSSAKKGPAFAENAMVGDLAFAEKRFGGRSSKKYK